MATVSVLRRGVSVQIEVHPDNFVTYEDRAEQPIRAVCMNEPFMVVTGVVDGHRGNSGDFLTEDYQIIDGTTFRNTYQQRRTP